MPVDLIWYKHKDRITYNCTPILAEHAQSTMEANFNEKDVHLLCAANILLNNVRTFADMLPNLVPQPN